MPINIINKVSEDSFKSVISGKTLLIVPNQAHFDHIEDEILQNHNNLWGNSIITLQNFIKEEADPLEKTTLPLIEQAIIKDILIKTELKYFENLKTEPSIFEEFYKTISILRKNLIKSGILENELHNRGSLRENDLLVVFRNYEEILSKNDLNDEGQLFEKLLIKIEKNKSKLLRGKENITLDGFEIITPQLQKLVKAIDSYYPEMDIEIAVSNIPNNPLYSKYLNIVDRSLKDISRNSVERASDDLWNLDSEIELHECRSTGHEARFIAKRMEELVTNGMSLNEIELIASSNNGRYKPLLHELNRAGIIPGKAFMAYRGIQKDINEIIKNDSTLPEKILELEEKVANGSKKAFRARHLPELASILRDAQTIFQNGFYSRITDQLGFDGNLLSDIFLQTAKNNQQDINRTFLDLNWVWWGEEPKAKSKKLFIPFVEQGSVPPENSGCLFFQENSFLPGNAPDFFAQLFPQTDSAKAKESFRLRKYLSTGNKHITLSLSRIDNAGKENYPSSVLTMLKHSAKDEAQINYSSTFKANKENIINRSKNETVINNRSSDSDSSVVSNPEIKNEIKTKFTNQIYSASQLERFARCPYQYYLNKVAKLDPIEPITPDIDPRHRGTIIHRIMELFYENEVENVLKFIRNEIEFDNIIEKIDTYIDDARKEHKDLLETTHDSLIRHFLKRAKSICIEAVKLEIDLIKNMDYPLLPKYTEWKFGETDNNFLELTNKPLRKPAKIMGFIDRIDVDEIHQTFSVTDYKTGMTEAIPNKIRKGEHLQLPLYIEATKRHLLPNLEPVGAFLFSLKKMEKKHGIAKKESKKFYFSSIKSRMFLSDDEWQEIMDIALTTAANYIQQIRDGEFIENRDQCMKLCDYKDICRYGKK